MGNICSNRRREIRVVLIGLDKAGKTSLLKKLRFGEAGSPEPTVGFNLESIRYKNVNINIWDTGGNEKIRSLWKHYYEEADGVLYVVDSTDDQRMNEAKEALHHALHDINLQNGFVCIVANKCDLGDKCLPSEAIKEKLELTSLLARRSWTLQETSALDGSGLEALQQWLSKQNM